MEIATTTETRFPCNEELRERVRALRQNGEITNTKLAKLIRVNDSVVSQYLSDAGCIYPGTVAKVERKILAWLDRRDAETMAGIPTIETVISQQIASAARMLRRCRIMGRGIGAPGIGKTRGASLLRADDADGVYVHYVSGETGTREAVRSWLFAALGVQGPRKRTASRRRTMYAETCKRLRDTDILLVLDQAHRLTLPAMEFLAEVWNDTRAPQLWLGTDALHDKLDRDEQVASRVAFTFELSVYVGKNGEVDVNEVRPLVNHQIKHRLPDLGPDAKPIQRLCEKLALDGSFRRVEMHLATMIYLREQPSNQTKSWVELFEQASFHLQNQD